MEPTPNENTILVDASSMPKQITDFAFHKLLDDISQEMQNNLEIDYDNQTVTIKDSDDGMRSVTVKSQIESNCDDKLTELLQKVEKGYEIGLNQDDVEMLRGIIHNDGFRYEKPFPDNP